MPLWCPLILLLRQSKPNSLSLLCSSSLNCLHNPSLQYVHVSSTWGAQNLTLYSACISAVLRREEEASPSICWLHSRMLLAFSAARTADSRSTYSSVGTPSSFATNLLLSQLASHLVLQGYAISGAGLQVAAAELLLRPCNSGTEWIRSPFFN